MIGRPFPNETLSAILRSQSFSARKDADQPRVSQHLVGLTGTPAALHDLMENQTKKIDIMEWWLVGLSLAGLVIINLL